MMSGLARLRRMGREELKWRVRALARTHADRFAARIRPPQWDRSALATALAPHAVDPVLRTHIERRDWPAVHRGLARKLRSRPSRFVLDHAAALDVRGEILARWPEAARDAIARADRMLRGEYDLLGYRGLSFARPGHAIDWHLDPVHKRRPPRTFWADVPYLDPRFGDHKIVWELNRHQHWLVFGRALWLTRERRYGWAIIDQLTSWLGANPPLTGTNWASMLELGFRSISWIWSLHFLLADTDAGAAGPAQRPWLVDLLVALDRQLTHIEGNLSYYFSPNTHLTGEALALYVAGLALPELAGSQRWVETGRRVLLQEIDNQIAPDGGHLERSVHYHRYAHDYYLLALLTAQRANDRAAIGPFADALARMAEFMLAIADDDGRLPRIGDDDGGMLFPIAGRDCADARDSLAAAAVVLGRPELSRWGVPEEVFWLAPRAAVEQQPFVEAHLEQRLPLHAETFSDTGYVTMRDRQGSHLVFDAGHHGYLNGGHAHADALAITLGVNGRPLLIDPGTSTYVMDRGLRDRMRSSRTHNTLTLDGQPPSAPAGPFHWRSRTDAHLDAWRHNPSFAWAEGSHEGYGSLRHRRSVFHASEDGWLIVDEVVGRGRHTAEAHWHFDPAWLVRCDAKNRLRATLEGQTAWLLHDGGAMWLVHGDEESGLGWAAPAYGQLVPTTTARFTRKATAPFSMITWLGVPPPHGPVPSLHRIRAECDPGSQVVAVRIVQGDSTAVTAMRPGEGEDRETRSCEVAEYHTNGRLLHYTSRAGRFASLALADASHVLALREGWISVAAEDRLPDLHVTLNDDILAVSSSAPTARLRLQGAAVRHVRALSLNGREALADSREREDTLVIRPSDWSSRQLPAPRLPTPKTNVVEITV